MEERDGVEGMLCVYKNQYSVWTGAFFGTGHTSGP